MDELLRRERKGILKPLAGSALFHLAFFAAAMLLFTAEPKREFFTPVTVNIIDSSALNRRPSFVKEEAPASSPEPARQEKTVKSKIKEAPPRAARVDDAVKDLALRVKKKEASSLVESRVNDLRKKEELEAGRLRKKLDEVKNRVSSGANRQVQPFQPKASGGASRSTMDNRYAAYLSLISSRVQEEWGVLDELKNYRSEIIVAVKIGRAGNLIDLRIEKSSGNARFDESLLKAVKKASPFPPLPQDFKESFMETGFRFCQDCKG